MIKVKIESIAEAVKAAHPVAGMPHEWRSGAISACGVVARAIARDLATHNKDFDVARFLEACDVDPDTFA